jgi:hypothetical protein
MKQWLGNLPKKYWTTAHILWAVFVFGLHAMSSKSFPKISFWENFGVDKIVHFFMFGIGTSLAIISGWGKLRALVVWISAGLILEYYQLFFTSDRLFDWLDVLADLLGICFSALLTRSLLKQD